MELPSWVIDVFAYSGDTVVVAPIPYKERATSSAISHEDAIALCKSIDIGGRLPNPEEAS